MVRIPDHVRGTPATARGKSWKAWYRPANTRRDLPHGTKTGAMDDFLMSDRIQDISDRAAGDIVDEARQLASGSMDSGSYARSFKTESDHVVTVSDPNPNPRRAARVVNTSAHAPAVEFGNSKVEGKRIMRRAGGKFDSPEGGGFE